MTKILTMVVTSEAFPYPHVINASDFNPEVHTPEEQPATAISAALAASAANAGSAGEPADGQNGGAGTGEGSEAGDGSQGAAQGDQGGNTATGLNNPVPGKPVPQVVKIGSKWFVVDGATGAKMADDGFKTKGDAENAAAVFAI